MPPRTRAPAASPPPRTRAPATPRKRGAPYGNKNAFKHGLYARHYSPEELREVEDFLNAGLQHEIAALRVVVNRLMRNASQVDSLDENCQILGVLCSAVGQIASLKRTQAWVELQMRQKSGSSMDDILMQAIAEVQQEWKLEAQKAQEDKS